MFGCGWFVFFVVLCGWVFEAVAGCCFEISVWTCFFVLEREFCWLFEMKKEEFAGEVAQYMLGYLGKKC